MNTKLNSDHKDQSLNFVNVLIMNAEVAKLSLKWHTASSDIGQKHFCGRQRV